MLTNKGKYGLKALVHLAALPAGESALGADIAKAHNLPKKFLDAILNDLRNANIIRAKKGRGGGYSLARPAKEILVGDIIRVLDGPLAPIACASVTAYYPCQDCVSVDHCVVRMMMLDVRNAMSNVLDGTTLETLCARSNARTPELMYYI